MANLSIDILEKLVLAEDKRSVLRDLTPHSEHYNFLELLIDLHEGKTGGEVDKRVKSFVETPQFNNNYKKKVWYLNFFNQIKTTENKSELFKELIKKLNLEYNYSKPNIVHIARDDLIADEKDKLTSELNKESEAKITLKDFAKQITDTGDINLLYKLNDDYLHHLDLKKLNTVENIQLLINVFDRAISLANIPAAEESFLFLQSNGYPNNLLWWNKFTLAQRENLLKNPEILNTTVYFESFARDKFPKTTDSLFEKTEDYEEKVKRLQKEIEFFSKVPQKYQNLLSAAICNLLQLNLKHRVYDEDLFIKYIKNPGVSLQFFSQQYQQEQRIMQENNGIENLSDLCRCDVSSKFFEDYLLYFLKKESDVKKYSEFFDLPWLNRLATKARLLRGEDAPNAYQVLGESELKQLNEQALLDIKFNPLQFKKGEKVKLKALLKNIKELFVRVYEINTLNYLLEKKNINYDQIMLAGLIPIQEASYTYKQRPIEIHTETFEFDNLGSKPRGVYVIEFVGGEVYAKAVIRIGSLRLLNDRILGRKCLIVDEEDKVCTGDKTGLYIKNKFFNVNSEGYVIIPNNVENINEEVVINHEEFADLSNLMTVSNNYKLNINLFYSPEEFVTGNQVVINVSTALLNNGVQVPISLLKNVEVLLKTRTENQIENQIPINNIELKDNKDFTITFLMPSKIILVNVVVKGTVQVLKEDVKVEALKVLFIDKTKSSLMTGLHLKRDQKNGYTITVLGSNGEVKKGKTVSLALFTKFKNDLDNFSLLSDEFGKVYLHKLTDISSLSATCDDAMLNFDVFRQEKDFDYEPKQIVTVGQTLKYDKVATDEVEFLKIFTDNRVEADLTKSVKVQEKSIELTLKEEGNYKLRIGSQTISILCLEGKNLDFENKFIKTDNFTMLNNITEQEMGVSLLSKNNEVEGQVHSTNPNVRGYLITSNFLPERFPTMSILSLLNFEPKKMTNYPLINKYTEQASVGDELIYVSERKSKKSYMGNTLEKPGIILKRQKVTDTKEGEQELRQHGLARAADCMRPPQCGVTPTCCEVLQQETVSEIAFLANPGKITTLNIENFKFKIPKSEIDPFSVSYVLVHDGVHLTLTPVSLEDKEVKKVNKTLKESKKSDNIYFFDRKVDYLQTGAKKSVKNISNTEISFVTNVSSLWDTILLIGDSTGEAAQWKFLPKWDTLSALDKLKNYDKYCSHELNLFLFFKDAEFFKEVVLPFIANKKEKTIVDYFLLDDAKGLEQFCSVGDLSSHSSLDLVFLCLGTFKSNPKFSNSVKSYLKANAALRKLPLDQKKRLFDSILSSKKDDGPAPPHAEHTLRSNLDGGVMPEAMGGGGGGGEFENRRLESYASPSGMMVQGMSNVAQVTYDPPGPGVAMYRSGKAQAMEKCIERSEDLQYMNQLEDFNQQAVVYSSQQGTTEYKERNYYFQPNNIIFEEFWVEFCDYYCKNNSAVGFSSENYIYACNGNSKAIVISAVIDLQFKAVNLKTEKTEEGLTITAENPLLIFSKEVKEEKADKIDLNVLVAERFYDPLDQFIIDEESEGAQIEKPVTEFIIGKVYGSRVVVTNSTPNELTLTLAYEIPQGSIPINLSDQMKLETLKVPAFLSQVFDFQFYFPQPGQFTIYPATVTKGDKIVASADLSKFKFDVKETLTEKKTDTIVDILSTGSVKDIIEFIRTKNILNVSIFQFDQIYWLLKNKDFYLKLTEVLREKGLFDRIVWSFSLVHGDLQGVEEYLRSISKDEFSCFSYLVNSFVNRREFDFREYYPLVNPRAYALGGKKQNILNDSFKKTYQKYLQYLVDKWVMDSEDKVALVAYLILQDRMEEGIALFSSITPESLSTVLTKLQYDYLAAYINFLNGYPKFTIAKEITEKYLMYPVLNWRNLFVEIANQLAEFEEKELSQKVESEKAESNQAKAQKSSNFKCEIVNDSIKIESENIKSFCVKFYKIDIEVLFSLKPFRKDTDSTTSFVKPFLEVSVSVNTKDGATSTQLYPIPKELIKESLFIEINHKEEGSTKSKFLEYTPFLLNYSVNQEFGIVKIVDPLEKKPVPKVYIKCFAQFKNGSVNFYKDGYTDIRGSFDYASLSKDKIDDIEKFSILILSPDFGSKVFQVDPPVKIGKTEGEVVVLANKEFQEKRKAKQAISTQKYADIY